MTTSKEVRQLAQSLQTASGHLQKKHRQKLVRTGKRRTDVTNPKHQAERASERFSGTWEREIVMRSVSPSTVVGTITENDLVSLRLPAVNPFLQASQRAKNKRGKSQALTLTKTADVEIVACEATPLTLAGPNNYFDTNVETQHDDATQRMMCGTLYARMHQLNEAHIAKLTPSRHGKKSANSQLTREQIKGWQYEFQNSIQSILLEGVKGLVKGMGGRDLWGVCTPRQRMDVYQRVWKEDKLAMAIASLGMIANSVPLDQIFSDTTPAHVKWQRFYATIFEWACDDVFIYRVNGKDQKVECFKRWRNMVNDDKFKQLDLGGIDEIPVKPGSVFDVGQREKPLRYRREEDYNIAPN